jgi:hypothetical protein
MGRDRRDVLAVWAKGRDGERERERESEWVRESLSIFFFPNFYCFARRCVRNCSRGERSREGDHIVE